MRHRLISSVLILTLILAWSGCQSVPQHKGAAVGAGVGAAAGTATTSASIAQDGNHAARVNVNAIRRTDL